MTVIEFFQKHYECREASISLEGDRPFIPLLVGMEGELLLVTLGHTGKNYALATPEICWIHPHIPEVSYFSPVSLELQDPEHLTESELGYLRTMLAEAERRRRKLFRPCFHCRRVTQPGHAVEYDDRFVCRGCAETVDGIVF